jgi:cation transport regulator ChaC
MIQGAYVFGYGSLIERESRTRTNSDAIAAWPARVAGYERGWYHQFANNVGSTCTYLGAVEDPTATVNGVIYAVDDFEKTKERETGYAATEVLGEITMLDGGGPWDRGKVYIFLSKPEYISKTKEPTQAIPMVQSYVDICVNGCLEIEALYRAAGGFAKEFIRTSSGWNEYWVNDRIYPRRPFIYRKNASAIDTVLQDGDVLKYVQLHDLG